LVNYQLFGSYELVRHCLEMVPRSRSQSPLLLALMPTDWQAAIPMWTFSWIIACKEYVEFSGDSTFIEGIYPEIRDTLEAYRGFLNADGLFDTSSWNLLDWAPIDIPYVGVVTAQQAQLSQCHRIAAQMAESLGLHSEAESLREYADQMKKVIQEFLWDEEGQVYLDGIHRRTGKPSTTRSLQTHVLLYLADCLGERQAAIIEKKLLDPPEDWVKIGSPFFSFYMFEVWQRFGELERTLEQIRTDWGQMIRYGATTTWETFNVFPRSHAHAWSAAPAFVLGNQVLGVEKLEDGFRKIRVKPPATKLLWAEGMIPTAYGRMDVSWSKEADKPTMRLSVPQGIQIEPMLNGQEDWDIQIVYVGG
ncbi:MAG: alpha-L-rhamnosidase, partial [Paenibacillus sp.]|nr:alpha-L-rhamnosidase [Paenibacillus sp.]